KMSSWSRAMLIPLAIINHFKPTRSLPGNKQLHELYPLGTEQSDLRLPRSERFWTWRNFFLRLNDVLKILHPLRIRPTRKRALAESGLPADGPALRRAAKWLLDKEVRIRGDWQFNNSHPEASGWAFEYNNVYYPDVDDTAMVLMALRLAKPDNPSEVEKTFRRAL